MEIQTGQVGETGLAGAEVKEHRLARALGAGLVGATVLTAVHEGARLLSSRAPRMDRVGEQGLADLFAASGRTPPRGNGLYAGALVGDVLMNGLYYSAFLLGRARRPMLRGGIAGVAAGVGALLLPQVLGLGRPPGSRRADTQGMTVGWYLIGGLAAAAAFKLMSRGQARGASEATSVSSSPQRA